jgi:hypothetical protein
MNFAELERLARRRSGWMYEPSGYRFEDYVMPITAMNTAAYREIVQRINEGVQKRIENSLLTGDANRGNMNTVHTNHSTGATQMNTQTNALTATFMNFIEAIKATTGISDAFADFIKYLEVDNDNFRTALREENLDRRKFMEAVGDAIIFPHGDTDGKARFRVTISERVLLIERANSPINTTYSKVASLDVGKYTDRVTVTVFTTTIPQVWKPVSA